MINNCTPENSLQDGNCKDNKTQTQYRIVNQFLHQNIASRFMVAMYTGIPIQNVCWYVNMHKKRNAIAIVRIDRCEISGEMVEFLSTNPDNFPKINQMKLWDEKE